MSYNKSGTRGQASNEIQEHYAEISVLVLAFKYILCGSRLDVKASFEALKNLY